MATEDTRTKVLDDPVLSKVDMKKPSPEDAFNFHNAIIRSQGYYDIQETITNPFILLEQARNSLSKVSQDLNSSHKAEIVKLIQDQKGEQFINDIKILISDITMKTSKHN